MPKLTIRVAGPADRLLLAGLTALQPVIDELAGGVLLIGGSRPLRGRRQAPVELRARPTRDVDLGIDRSALGLTSTSRRIHPLLEHHDFHRRPPDERFRYRRDTAVGEFLLDLLLPKGASRHDPPLIEAGLDSIAAPGLAYAIQRGPDRLDLDLVSDRDSHRFSLPIAKLDAMLVMKAALVADGVRTQRDRRITDTADAVMLAVACTHAPESLDALRANRRRSEPKRALRWLRESFGDERSQAARRVEQHIADEHGQSGGGAWAVGAVRGFLKALDASPTQVRSS